MRIIQQEVDTCINRIRLEFKVVKQVKNPLLFNVLIESDWNLKKKQGSKIMGTPDSINRIRLEFKVNSKRFTILSQNGINRIRLEFKGKCKNDS